MGAPRELTKAIVDEFVRRRIAGEKATAICRDLGISSTWFYARLKAAGIPLPRSCAPHGGNYAPIGNEPPVNTKSNEPPVWPGRFEDDPKAGVCDGMKLPPRPDVARTWGGIAEY